MYSKKQRPSWWLLYLSLPMMIGLFLIEMRLSLSDTGHRFAEFIIVLIVFVSMSLWLKANTGALIQEDQERWQAARIKKHPFENGFKSNITPICKNRPVKWEIETSTVASTGVDI